VALCIGAFGLWIDTKRPDILITDTGRLLGILQKDVRALNRKRGNGFAARVWLENDGDKAKQPDAVSRWPGAADAFILDFGAVKFGYIWPKKTDPVKLAAFCAKSDILVTPNWKLDLTGGCRLISQKYLKHNGSVAIFLAPQGARIESARQVTGARLWNAWWLRKKP